MSIIIRKAIINDAEELLNLYKTNLLEVDKFLPDLDRFVWTISEEIDNIRDHSRHKNLYIVATADNQIVGNLVFKAGEYRKNEHSGSFGMSVRLEWRQQGVGTKLLEQLIKWCKKNKIKRLELEVWSNNLPAIKLYKKFGFKLEGKKKQAYKIGSKFIDGIIMAKIFNF